MLNVTIVCRLAIVLWLGSAIPIIQAQPGAISAGAVHTCVVAPDGAKCWGLNTSGQLGDGTTINRSTPVAVTGLPGPVTAVVAGGAHSCAIAAEGKVHCWGRNSSGQLGNGNNIDSATPAEVIALSGVRAISAGDKHTCALTASGHLRCWGSSQYFQLGYSDFKQKYPDQNVPVDVSWYDYSLLQASAISAGGNHTCVIDTGPSFRSAGTCWGQNFWGQLGNGTDKTAGQYINISGFDKKTTFLSSISAGWRHTCSLASSGVAMCWGANEFGALGDGTYLDRKVPVTVAGLSSGAKDISAGGDHTCALLQDGGVVCWGDNRQGALGVGDNEPRATPAPVIGLNGEVTAISTGLDHSCAITKVGQIQCWGSNNYGQLGNGSPADYSNVPVTIQALKVAGLETTITLESLVNPAKFGDTITLVAKVSGAHLGGVVKFSVADEQIYEMCIVQPDSNGQAFCDVPAVFRNDYKHVYIAEYSGDAVNRHASTVVLQEIDGPYATQSIPLPAKYVSVASNTMAPRIADSITLAAQVITQGVPELVTTGIGSPYVIFKDNGKGIPECTDKYWGERREITWLPKTDFVHVATCTVNAISAGPHSYTATFGGGGGANDVAFVTSAPLLINARTTGPAHDYTDMWWVGSQENGWGMSITQHGATQFAVFFVYDNNGQPVWYAMPGGNWNADFTAYTGNLYQPTSSPFSAYDAAQFKVGGATNGPVGTATIAYNGKDKATVAYTINGMSGSKSIQRQLYGPADERPKLQVHDLWWGGIEQNGWGINIAQQERTLFSVWYTYDQNGKTIWYVMPGGNWNGNTYWGPLYRTTSSAWLGTAYDTSLFKVQNAGKMSLTFTDVNQAEMTYTLDGMTQTKKIVRQPY